MIDSVHITAECVVSGVYMSAGFVRPITGDRKNKGQSDVSMSFLVVGQSAGVGPITGIATRAQTLVFTCKYMYHYY